MLRLPERAAQLIDVLDTNVSPVFAIAELCEYFDVTPDAFLSDQFSLYHVVYKTADGGWRLAII